MFMDMLAEGYESERYEESFVYFGLTINEALHRIAEIKPDLIGISLLFSNLAAETFRLCKAIKEKFRAIPLVLGGHHPSAMPRDVMNNEDIELLKCAFLMIGFPGETRESIHNTAQYALSLGLDDFALSVVYCERLQSAGSSGEPFFAGAEEGAEQPLWL